MMGYINHSVSEQHRYVVLFRKGLQTCYDDKNWSVLSMYPEIKP